MGYPVTLPNSHIYEAIADERARQESLRRSGKFLHTCASEDFAAFTHFGRTTVLGEEFGEVCRAALDAEQVAEGRHDPASALQKLRTELIHVAAVAVAYVEALDYTAPPTVGHARKDGAP